MESGPYEPHENKPIKIMIPVSKILAWLKTRKKHKGERDESNVTEYGNANDYQHDRRDDHF